MNDTDWKCEKNADEWKCELAENKVEGTEKKDCLAFIQQNLSFARQKRLEWVSENVDVWRLDFI